MILCKAVIVLVSLMCCCSAEESDVLQLTDDDFFTAIVKHETILVMFYSPWCSRSKQLLPEYANAAGMIKANNVPAVLAKVDCVNGGPDACLKVGLTGYPTLKIFRNGGIILQEYGCPHEAAGILKYVQSQFMPSAEQLPSMSALEDFIGKNEVVVVGFFEAVSNLKEAFLEVADKLRLQVLFGISEDAEVLAKQGEKDAVVLFYPKHLHNMFEPSSLKYEGASKKHDIEAWIIKYYHGLVGHRQTDNAKEFKNPLVLAYYAVDYIKDPKGTNYWRNRILKVAKNFGGLKFAISDKNEFDHELYVFCSDRVKGDKPLVLARNDQNQKFIMKDEFTLRSFEKFLNDMQANKLDPDLKSGDPVIEAVSKNFEEVVTNNGRDTLLELYSPRSSHCKRLKPILHELGQKMKDEDVAIVKMDATVDDIPPSPFVVLESFPAFYWVAKNRSVSPVSYEGGRKLNDFVKYIAKEATSELQGWDRKGNIKKQEL